VRPEAIPSGAAGRVCVTFAPPRREERVGAEAPERIRLVAKLVVRRSGPGAARYAYRWQSAWENPITASYHGRSDRSRLVLQ